MQRQTQKVNQILNKISIAVVCFSKHRLQQANDFCQSQNLPLLKTKSEKYDLQLLFHDDLIELHDKHLDTTLSIDFIGGNLGHRHQFGGGRGQAIAKAVGLKSGNTPSILDATAGLAGDAFVLASLGCSITMIEKSAILFSLIENAIERASLSEQFTPILEKGFEAINQDSIDYINHQINKQLTQPDVIYIDPMYPERKKSALVKKDMQILQRLHKKSETNSELLEAALSHAKKRVVVKRPVNAETLNDRKPSTCIKSKKTRYDIYTNEKM